jgi:hypothetical protein
LENSQSVKSSLAAGATVIPGHGRPIAPDELEFAIEYLGTINVPKTYAELAQR